MNKKNTLVAILIAVFALAGCSQSPSESQENNIYNTQSSIDSATPASEPCDLSGCQEQDPNMLIDELF